MPIPPKITLDRDALEARTQAIGQELFAAAKQAHAHLSAPNRWTEQVLSWCLSSSQLKCSVLRFLDVLPSLHSPRAVARHVREYFSSDNFQLPAVLRVGSTLARSGLVTAPALAAIVRQMVEQVARQFIAESKPAGAAEILTLLAARGANCSLDVLGEQVLSEAEADRYASQYATLLKDLTGVSQDVGNTPIATCGPRINLSIKPSALTPRFDPLSPASSLAAAEARLVPILRQASDSGALINLDMEQYERRDLTIELAKHLLVHPQTGTRAALGIVVQAYLKDAEATTDALLEWLAAHERPLTIRLVKGAYWDSELAQAAHHHWPVPVFKDKADTDHTFERLTERLLSAHPLVTTAVASHNVRSIAHAMAVAEALGLARTQLEFQLLYGMGDALHGAIVDRGYPVRIYTPIGQLIPGMAYLVRRILENTSHDSFLRQEYLQERTADELLRPPATVARSAPRPTASGTEWVGEPSLNPAQVTAREHFAQALQTVRGQWGRTYPALVGKNTIEREDVLVVRNPSNPTEVLGRVCMVSPGDADRAVAVATEAQVPWARVPATERVACLRRAAELMRTRRHELAAWEVYEVGKTWREADADLVEAIDFLEYYGAQMLELARGRPLVQRPGEQNRYVYVPRGIAVVIAPWNFPIALLTGMAAAALVTGNAVILKPAEESSLTAALLVQLLREAGIPPGVVQFLPGYGHEIGAALVRHPRTHVTLFTGSKAVGLSIIGTSAQVGNNQSFVKHVVAEMGGKNAMIVDEDADVDAAVQGILHSAFGYAGQKCSAASRLIVHTAVYDQVLSRLAAATDRLVVGDPVDPNTDLGPLINEEAQQRLVNALTNGREIAQVVYAYPQDRLPKHGYFVGPVILSDVPRRHPLAREELFGPLLSVFRVPSFSEALDLANSTEYALTGGVYSRSPANLARAAEVFDVGNLYFNRAITGAVVGRQPFGGHRLSGLGTKAGGPDYLRELVVPKTITEDTSRHGMPLE